MTTSRTIDPNARGTMTPREFADFIGVGYRTALDITHREGFPVIVVGRKRLIPKEALEKWMMEQRETY